MISFFRCHTEMRHSRHPKMICLHTITPAALDRVWVEKDVFSVVSCFAI